MSLLPFKRILLPTDFSEPSRNAMIKAVELVAHFTSKLYLLHVVSPIPVVNPVAYDYLGSGLETDTIAGLNIPKYQESLIEGNRNMLRKVIEEVVPEKIEVESLVEVGDAAGVINEIANREHIDLIVMATHGLTGVSHFLLGSVAERVIRHASVPVLTLRHPEQDVSKRE